MENEQHVLLRCRAYAHIKERYDDNIDNLKKLLERPTKNLGMYLKEDLEYHNKVIVTREWEQERESQYLSEMGTGLRKLGNGIQNATSSIT